MEQENMEFLNTAEMAEQLNVTSKTIREWTKAGEIPFAITARWGKKIMYFFPKEKAEEFIQERKTYTNHGIDYRIEDATSVQVYMSGEDGAKLKKYAGGRKLSPFVRAILLDYITWREQQEKEGNDAS